MGVLALGHRTVCFVSLELGPLVLSLRIFFLKNLLSSWWTVVDVALALILARLLLEGCCPLVPRSLPPVVCGGGAGPGLTGPARLDISLLTAWRLVLGPCFLDHAPSIRRLPMGWHSWGFVYVSTFLKCCLYYFLEILDFISSEALVPSSVTFDSFSSSAPSIFMPGLIRKRGWECWSVSSSTSLRES